MTGQRSGGLYRARGLLALVVAVVLLAACGSGSSDDAAASQEDDYEIRAGSCDPIRGEGTISNRAGEPAAFRVIVAYEYRGEDLPSLQRKVTPVLADGESFDFSVGPDPSRGAPSSCRIIGAERVAADEADVAEVEEREEAAPEAEVTEEEVRPLWLMEGVGGSIQAVASEDGIGFLATDLSGGGAIFAVEVDTGEVVWEAEVDERFRQLVPDGRGGVLAVTDRALLAYDQAGEEVWRSVPLARDERSPAGSIDHIAVLDDVVLVGGQAPSALAGIDRDTGTQRWHLAGDGPGDPDPIGFSGGGSLVAVTDHGVLVAGGVPSLHHLALLDVGGDAPEVVWSIPDVGTNASTDGSVVVDAFDGSVTAWDVATGEELWSASDPEWERAAVVSAPAIVDDVVIVQRPRSTMAFDLSSGEERWEDVDMPGLWSFIGSDVRVGDRVFGQVSTTQFTLLGSDGALSEVTVAEDIRGTLSGVAADGDLVLLAARGSTGAQGSTVWALDLGTHR